MPRRRNNLLLVALAVWTVSAASADDIVMTAMWAELDRTADLLRLEGAESPSYVSYTTSDLNRVVVSGALGGVSSTVREHRRSLQIELTVGEADSNNALFASSRNGIRRAIRGRSRDYSLPSGDDYDALRSAIWLATDSEYKRALSDHARKMAFLNDRPVNLSAPIRASVKPVGLLEDVEFEDLRSERLHSLVRLVSGSLSKHPHITESTARAVERTRVVRYVNSEGTRYRHVEHDITVRIWASSQDIDGRTIQDAVVVRVKSWDDMPSENQLSDATVALSLRLKRLQRADLATRYIGPVLFEGSAASEVISQVLAPKLVGVALPVGDSPGIQGTINSLRSPYLDRIGKKVLPEWLSVVDDPTRMSYEGKRLHGSRSIDTDGSATQKTALVVDGVLKTLLSTRNVPAELSESTGSSNLGVPVPTNVFVHVDGGASNSMLRDQLVEQAVKEGMDYGVVVTRIYNSERIQFPLLGGAIPSAPSGSQLLPAVVAFKLYRDGRQELIRHAQFEDFTERTLRDIVSASSSVVRTDTPIGGPSLLFADRPILSVVTPSLLISEATVTPRIENPPRTPAIPHPLESR